MATNPQAPPTPLVFPTVDRKVVDDFANQWNFNGIAIVLDNSSKQFAHDFANIVLKSFCIDQINKFNAVKAAQAAQAAAVGTQTVLPPDHPVPEKRLIVEA